jgi:hypothetical protein
MRVKSLNFTDGSLTDLRMRAKSSISAVAIFFKRFCGCAGQGASHWWHSPWAMQESRAQRDISVSKQRPTPSRSVGRSISDAIDTHRFGCLQRAPNLILANPLVC